MLTSEVLTMVVSRVDSNRLRHRLQRVSFMNRVLACFIARAPECEQVQAPYNDVIPLVFDLFLLGDDRDTYWTFMTALLLKVPR